MKINFWFEENKIGTKLVQNNVYYYYSNFSPYIKHFSIHSFKEKFYNYYSLESIELEIFGIKILIANNAFSNITNDLLHVLF